MAVGVEVGFMVELLTYMQKLSGASRGFLIPKFENRCELLDKISRTENWGLFNGTLFSIRSMDSFRCFTHRRDYYRFICHQHKLSCLYSGVDASAAAMSHRPNSSSLAAFSVLGERKLLICARAPRSPSVPLYPSVLREHRAAY